MHSELGLRTKGSSIYTLLGEKAAESSGACQNAAPRRKESWGRRCRSQSLRNPIQILGKKASGKPCNNDRCADLDSPGHARREKWFQPWSCWHTARSGAPNCVDRALIHKPGPQDLTLHPLPRHKVVLCPEGSSQRCSLLRPAPSEPLPGLGGLDMRIPGGSSHDLPSPVHVALHALRSAVRPKAVGATKRTPHMEVSQDSGSYFWVLYEGSYSIGSILGAPDSDFGQAHMGGCETGGSSSQSWRIASQPFRHFARECKKRRSFRI